MVLYSRCTGGAAAASPGSDNDFGQLTLGGRRSPGAGPLWLRRQRRGSRGFAPPDRRPGTPVCRLSRLWSPPPPRGWGNCTGVCRRFRSAIRSCRRARAAHPRRLWCLLEAEIWPAHDLGSCGGAGCPTSWSTHPVSDRSFRGYRRQDSVSGTVRRVSRDRGAKRSGRSATGSNWVPLPMPFRVVGSTNFPTTRSGSRLDVSTLLANSVWTHRPSSSGKAPIPWRGGDPRPRHFEAGSDSRTFSHPVPRHHERGGEPPRFFRAWVRFAFRSEITLSTQRAPERWSACW